MRSEGTIVVAVKTKCLLLVRLIFELGGRRVLQDDKCERGLLVFGLKHTEDRSSLLDELCA